MRIAQEEIFGPVAALFPFKDEDEVLLANSTYCCGTRWLYLYERYLYERYQ